MNESVVPMYILCSTGLLLTICIGVIIFLNRSQNKVNKILLNEKEMEIKFQNELLQNTVRTKEEERKRIATELHDDIASKLNIIHLNVHLLKKGQYLLESDLKLIDQIETSLNVSIERTRSISHELLPQVFKKFGIHHALKELEHAVNISQTILLSMESEHLINITNELKLLHIYRILQELIQNTIKYAEAKHIKIVFKIEDHGMITMTYSDDGKGFDPQKTSHGLGFGNILTRAKLLAGIAEFKSTPDIKGMLFSVKFQNND